MVARSGRRAPIRANSQGDTDGLAAALIAAAAKLLENLTNTRARARVPLRDFCQSLKAPRGALAGHSMEKNQQSPENSGVLTHRQSPASIAPKCAVHCCFMAWA